MLELKVKKVNKRLKEYSQIKELLHKAFPENEQFPMWLLLLLGIRKSIDFLAYYDEHEFCGFTYTVQNRNMAFVLYLAVNNKIRSRGYGIAILKHLKERFGEKPISLNVESLDVCAENYFQRLKRMEFYKKNGYECTNHALVEKDNIS